MEKLNDLIKEVNMLEAGQNGLVQHTASIYPFATELMHLNKIYHDDNREVLFSFSNKCVDLIYLDPPFYTQKGFRRVQ